MMATLSLPDVRDYASLKYEKLDWIVEPASLKGLRVGLMMEAGCGVAPTPEVAAAVERAAKDFEAAGAHVEPLKPFLTQAMLDGLDRFWRARALSDIGALPAERRARVLPFIRDWAEFAAGFSGVEVFRGFDQIPAMRKAAIAATAPFDYVLSPTAPMTAFPAEWPSPSRDPLQSVSAHRLHRRVQYVRAAGGVGQLRLRRGRPADRAADHRAPVRRPWRARGRTRLRGHSGVRGEALAGAAGGLIGSHSTRRS